MNSWRYLLKCDFLEVHSDSPEFENLKPDLLDNRVWFDSNLQLKIIATNEICSPIFLKAIPGDLI